MSHRTGKKTPVSKGSRHRDPQRQGPGTEAPVVTHMHLTLWDGTARLLLRLCIASAGHARMWRELRQRRTAVVKLLAVGGNLTTGSGCAARRSAGACARPRLCRVLDLKRMATDEFG